jgi:hypothetical protein
MKRFILFAFLPGIFFNVYAIDDRVVWDINNPDYIGGYDVIKQGNPTVISTPYGNAVEFHASNNERIQIPNYPLAGADEFTIEIIFKPYAMAAGSEPRFFYIGKPGGRDKKTATFETRYNSAGWYADYFIRHVNTGGFINPSLTHPIDEWTHLAMVYKNHTLTGYANGVQEAYGEGTTADGLPESDAQISLGGRMNNSGYFDGVILKVIFTPTALEPGDFTLVNKLPTF